MLWYVLVILPRNNINGSRLYNMSTLKLLPWYMRPLSAPGRKESIVETVEISELCCAGGAGQSVTELYCSKSLC